MKVLLGVLVAVFALVLAGGAYYWLVVHPDDARISFVEPSDPLGRSIEKTLAPVAARYKKVASVLQTPLPALLDIDTAVYGAKVGALLKTYPDYAIGQSRRFTSPYQVYLPIGDYPVRLEAMDGMFIPAGATLTVSPHLKGPHSVRFFAVATTLAGARLELKVGARNALGATLPRLAAPVANDRGVWQRNFGRFLRVDLAQTVNRWEPQRVDAEFAGEDDQLALKCVAASGPGCVVSDLTFYAPTTEPVKSAIVILVDTLRADGLESKVAPSLQGLAARSTQFTNAIAAGNMTSPSTNAFLSCRRPSDLGGIAFSYSATGAQREEFYATQPPSFPALFKGAGYDTAMIGNVSVISEIYGVGVQHGFDRQIALERDAYDTPDVTREAIAWLRDNADHPFLLYLHYNGPHAPYRAPFKDIKRTWPGLAKLDGYPAVLRWLYQSEISYTDRYLGKVFDAVRALGLEDSVEIVLTADHGDQHTARRFAPNAAGPTFEGAFFDHGATLYDDEIHVPLLVHEPGQREHREVAPYVTALDAAPTLLEAFAIPQDTPCAGRSLVPAVRTGVLADELVTRTFGSEAFQGRAIFFDGRYKYVRLYESTDKNVYQEGRFGGDRRLYFQERQLFDLAKDPNEAQDLAAIDAGLLARAEKLYDEYYGVKDGYELVVDDPGEKAFEVDLPPGTNARTEFDDVTVRVAEGGTVEVRGAHRRHSIVRLAAAPASTPVVRIDGLPVPVLMTSSRLPLQVPLTELPREQGGRYTLLEAGLRPEAYLRRVEDNGQDNRRIVTGNPRFEKVLREWGYLSDK